MVLGCQEIRLRFNAYRNKKAVNPYTYKHKDVIMKKVKGDKYNSKKTKDDDLKQITTIHGYSGNY